MRIGLISDTHGLLRPEALAALHGCEAIVHGGDIGDAAILDRLSALAPVHAVRGNNDTGAWAAALPERLDLCFGGVRVHVVHDLKELGGALPPNAQVVVSGHSHRPKVEERDGVLLVNPGSAGRRRFSLPVSVAWLELDGDAASARIEVLSIPR
jgi:putative phosphoesterase